MLFALGDIHGQKAMLDGALARIEAEAGPEARIIFLGDYVDRGPDSAGVLATLSEGMAEGRNWLALLGNHDRMFWRFVTDGRQFDANILSGKGWLHPALGGRTTLASYGVEIAGDSHEEIIAYCRAAREVVPQAHLDFIEGLPTWHQEAEMLFVHAGIRPGVPMEEQEEEDLIWIRAGFLDYQGDFGRLVVHGHTALEYPWHFGNRVDLDGGAGYGRPLCPAMFDAGRIWLLTEDGREELLPPPS